VLLNPQNILYQLNNYPPYFNSEMASTSRIPHLLESYISLPPESSLNLVTSVLGASANWLVLRHVYSYLRGSADGDESTKDTGVILLSFMRDGAFWREGSTKLVTSSQTDQ
jgi:elongator complex protein 6